MQIRIVKTAYFLLYAAFASWMSFFYVFLQDEPKLSGFEIGIIAAIQQLSSIFIVPLWGVLADRFGRKKVFNLSLIISCFGVLGFMYQGSFAFYVLFMIGFTSIYNPLTSLIDSIALDITEANKDISYGELRLWASIGWAVSTLATGYFIQWQGIEYIFPLASVLLGLTFLVTTLFYRPIQPKNLPKGVSFKVMTNLLGENRALTLFLLLVVVFTTFSSPIHLFINLYFNEIGATSQEIGWAFSIQSIFELPFFFYGNRIVKRFGVKNTFLFTMAVTAIRMLLYSYTSDPLTAIIIGTSHGICLALMLVSMVSFVHRIVPPHLKSTGQSIMYTAFAIGICLGNLLTGYFKDTHSIQFAMHMYVYIIIGIMGAVYLFSNKKTLPNTR